MKKQMIMIAVVATLSLFAANAALAQRGMMRRGGGGWGAGTAYARLFDPRTVETVSGEVVLIEKIKPMKGMRYGIHAVIRTDKETLSVHLGPDWYMENQDMEIAAKDKVEVKGSRVTIEGKPAIIASEVKKGEDILVLRDANGIPAWSGWRRR